MDKRTKNEKMSVWGIGGKWALWSIVLSLPVIAINRFLNPAPAPGWIPPWVFMATGTALLAAGLPFLLISARALRKNFADERLCTTGVFGICRNPIYAAWILFLVPGVLLFFQSLPLLIVPVIMYAVLRVFLPREETWLEAKYGQDYLDYKQRTNRILPTIRPRSGQFHP